MNVLQRRTYSIVMATVLFCMTMLSGCFPGGTDSQVTTAAPFQETPTTGVLSPEKLVTQQAFDAFTTEIFLDEISLNQLDYHFLLKDPEALGISAPQALFGSITVEDSVQTTTQLGELKKELDTFQIHHLTEDQKLTMRVLESHIKTQLLADGLELYQQPLASTVGVQAQLPILFSEYEFRRREDIDTYLQLIGGLDEYYGQILTLEQAKSEAGLMSSDTTIDSIIRSCESYLLVPGNNFLIDTFQSRLDTVADLTPEEKNAYMQQHSSLLEGDFVPAYQLLIDGLNALKGTGQYEGGLAHLPKGKDYYGYLVYDATGTSYDSIDEMLQDMELLIEDNLKIITTLTKENPALVDEIQTYAFRQTEPEAMLEELKTIASKDFPPLPQCNYTLKYVPKALELSLSPAFYLSPPIDDFRNNYIYINGNERFDDADLYTTIAHEGYPGHLYQTVYYRNKATSPLRQILGPTGYSEGWATYVEHYAHTLDNGLSSDMGQMLAANYIASLGLQACLDVYINYYGWTQEQVTEYLKTYYDDPGSASQELYNTMIQNPSNYVSYYVGYMEINNMLKIGEKQLGNKFELKRFHEFLLDIGPAPFDVIQPYFTSWLMDQKM